MQKKRPGLYLFVDKNFSAPEFKRWGDLAVCAVPGALVSTAETEQVWLGIDGILLGIDRYGNESDAAAALRIFQKSGSEGLRNLNGFYNILLVEKEAERAWLFTDLLAVRPYYIYDHRGSIVVSPDITFLRSCGLSVSLNRQVLYQMFRINHPLGGQCIIREIERTRPFFSYRISSRGLEYKNPKRIFQEPDPLLTLDDAADQMHETASAAVASILAHPLLASRELELPLTAGYDSRHLLGELLALGHPPDSVRHVCINELDFLPVKAICRDHKLVLQAAYFSELDHKELIRYWLNFSSGQVHLHQLYMLGVGAKIGSRPVLGLTAYLSGILFSYAPLGTPLNRRFYTRSGLGFLFRDHTRLTREFREQVKTEIAFFEGEKEFRLLAADAVNRSHRYAGAAFAPFDDQVVYFPPAAERGTWEWFRRIPAALALNQKARIRLFERHFPDLGKYPTQNGLPLIRTHPVPQANRPQRLRNPVPPNPHAWLRAYPQLGNLATRVVKESQLGADDLISPAGIRMLRELHHLGAVTGWALMSLITTEAAYRILLKGESTDSVADWMTA